jgi:hypothetical protein
MSNENDRATEANVQASRSRPVSGEVTAQQQTGLAKGHSAAVVALFHHRAIPRGGGLAFAVRQVSQPFNLWPGTHHRRRWNKIATCCPSSAVRTTHTEKADRWFSSLAPVAQSRWKCVYRVDRLSLPTTLRSNTQMAKRRNEFAEADKLKALLWCDRHCCLCGKPAGVGIEVAHLDSSKSDLDNAIPLCFACHAAIGHYNRDHPRGRKYSIPELRARRDQVYEQHTRHLVPPITYIIQQGGRRLPDVGFHISNVGSTYAVRARVVIILAQGSGVLGHPKGYGHYDGKYLWNLNPGAGVNGHFDLPDSVSLNSGDPLRARVDVTLIDLYERRHSLLAVGFVHRLGPTDEWYFEPSEEALKIPA